MPRIPKHLQPALARRASPWGQHLLLLLLALGLAVPACALLGVPLPSSFPFILLAALLVLIGVGVFVPAAGVFARPILAGPNDLPLIALTFDDGPDPEETPRILDLLEAHGHRGTFFVIGARAQTQRAMIEAIYCRGHDVGNHSYHHAYTTPFHSTDRLTRELTQANDVLRSAGVPVRFFRPPVGLISPPVAAAARRAGLELLAWSASARDGRPHTTVAQALARIVPALAPGAIIVLHDAVERGTRRPIAAAILTELLPHLEARGLRSVPLSELIPPQ